VGGIPVLDELRFMTGSERDARLRKLFDDPTSAMNAARRAGIDMSLTLRNMALAPEERWRRANATIAEVQRRRGRGVKPRIVGPL
jgi:ABC-type antimicrobial peptide transport system ATPase subunit